MIGRRRGLLQDQTNDGLQQPVSHLQHMVPSVELYGFYRGPSLGHLRARQRRQPSVMGLVALYERLSRLCFQPALGNPQSRLRKSRRAGELLPHLG